MERVVAEGDAVVVTYDYRIFKKAPIPQEIIDAFHKGEMEWKARTS